jgi:hypothetical protein
MKEQKLIKYLYKILITYTQVKRHVGHSKQRWKDQSIQYKAKGPNPNNEDENAINTAISMLTVSQGMC